MHKKNVNKPLYVTQPTLPKKNDFFKICEEIWENKILTHNGPKVRLFEDELSKKLSIDRFLAVTNGTIAIQMAIKALKLKGEIITPAFTWIATVSAIKWESCTPVFCDIEPDTLNLDPEKIEKLITPSTVAIIPVHVFGNPCDVMKINSIAKKHKLKVIYDAAHAIGSTFNGKSILTYGDISATSLHATKLLNTAEGGGCVTNDKKLYKKLERIRFFGHNDDKSDIVEDGFNGKLTEIHSALGLANLTNYDDVLEDRKYKYNYYLNKFSKKDKIQFQKHKIGESNFSYFPLVFDDEKILLNTQSKLNEHNIYPRRYFYPSVNSFRKILDYKKVPISEDISRRILCLPLYYDLKISEIDYIIDIVNNSL